MTSEKDIGDRFANAVKFALDGAPQSDVVDSPAETYVAGQTPGARSNRISRFAIAAVPWAIIVAITAAGMLLMWRSSAAHEAAERAISALTAFTQASRGRAP